MTAALQKAAEDAWETYAALARKVTADRNLLIDRPHMEAMARAHRDFAAALIASEAAR